MLMRRVCLETLATNGILKEKFESLWNFSFKNIMSNLSQQFLIFCVQSPETTFFHLVAWLRTVRLYISTTPIATISPSAANTAAVQTSG